VGVAEQESTGQFNFDDLETMSDEEARKSLEEMKGIGSWTADCYLMACLGRQDIWPVGDIGLQEGVRRLKDLKERPNVEDMTCLAREWRPFRSVAANLLWADYD
jgi:DNA-3-methyladenine glycosylase II